jgi:hypothetical protein
MISVKDLKLAYGKRVSFENTRLHYLCGFKKICVNPSNL